MKHSQKTAVIYIITKLELGGAQKVCLELFNNVASDEIDTFLISGAQGTLVDAVHNKTNVILLPHFKREVSLAGIWQELIAFVHLVQQLRSIKKNYSNTIVHTHSTKAGITGRFAALFAGIKHRIHTVHGYAFHNHQPRYMWWSIYLIELVTSFITTHFICVSSYDVEQGKKLFPRFAQKHSIIRAAVDWQQFYKPAQKLTTFPDAPTPFIFGTIACFKPQKNLFDLLKAFEVVHQRHPHTRLELIGDGTLKTDLKQWIDEHNLTDAITLHGWQKSVAPYMINWHAFVLSSLWEGLPCAIVEARLLKLPIISYDTGGIKDVVLHNHNGFLVPQGDWHMLATTMINIVNSPLIHTKLQGHNDNLHDFHHQTMVEKHSRLYQQLFNTQ